MTDWADEVADKLCAAGEYVGQTKAVSTALRKAKADGMREAAGVVLRSRGYIRNAGKPWAEDMPANKEDLISEIMNAASIIDPPQ